MAVALPPNGKKRRDYKGFLGMRKQKSRKNNSGADPSEWKKQVLDRFTAMPISPPPLFNRGQGQIKWSAHSELFFIMEVTSQVKTFITPT